MIVAMNNYEICAFRTSPNEWFKPDLTLFNLISMLKIQHQGFQVGVVYR